MQLRVIRSDVGAVMGVELNPGGDENPFWMPLPWNVETRQFEPQTPSHNNLMTIAQFEALIFPYSTEEALSWDRKVLECKAALEAEADQVATVAPHVVLEAQTRGVPVKLFAQGILQKSDLMGQRAAKISGTRGMHCDRVNRLATLEALQTYDWLAGWN
jgi:hypothetical protein